MNDKRINETKEGVPSHLNAYRKITRNERARFSSDERLPIARNFFVSLETHEVLTTVLILTAESLYLCLNAEREAYGSVEFEDKD